MYPDHPLVLHQLGALLLKEGKATEALPILEKARQSETSNPVHVLSLAECLLALDRSKEAKKLLADARRQGLSHPRADELYKLARACPPKTKKAVKSMPPGMDISSLVKLMQGGRYAEAVSRARTLLQNFPDALPVWRYLGMAHLALRQYQAAVDPLKRSLALNVELAETHFNLGFSLNQTGRVDEALAAYRAAIRLKPDLVEAHNNLGNMLMQLKRPDEALASFSMAQKLKPNVAEIRMNTGDALRELGRLNEAEQSYRFALQIKPDLAEAHASLSFVLSGQKRHEEALESCQKALELRPDDPHFHNNLGIILRKLKRPAEAANAFRFALKKLTSDVSLYRNYAHVLTDIGNMADARIALQHALEISPDDIDARSSLVFLLNYMDGVTPEEILDESRRYGDALQRMVAPYATHANSHDPDRKLNIGLISGDLGEHSVGFFLRNVLARIDHESFELFAYQTAPRHDELNADLQTLIPNWRDAARRKLNDDRLAELIRKDGIDILIDLAGHTSNNRLPVFARKPAPVQLSWLGYLGTTGLHTMDYVLADEWTILPGEESMFTEVPWRLPETYICFSPPTSDVAEGPLAAATNGFVTFGCFNNLNKISERVIDCWARLLEAVPNSRLYLKNKQLGAIEAREALTGRFGLHGIESARLVMEGQVASRDDHLRAHQRIDITLDPFPYPGITTTVESLWMGVPVLTLRGDRFLGHQGEMILNNAGLPEWVAANVDEYVDKAVSFAGDLQQLSELRQRLRGQIIASPLCDAPRFAKHFEAAMRGMWRNWCQNKMATQDGFRLG